MGRSAGLRFFVVGLLTLVMFLPLEFVSELVDDRADYNRQSLRSVSSEWGGAQLLSGPQLVIPVEETVTYERRRKIIDPVTGEAKRDTDGKIIYQYYSEDVVEARDPIYVYPNDLKTKIDTQSQTRYRGIFQIPVYTATARAEFDFPTDLAALREGAEVILWDRAELRIYLTSNRALRGTSALRAGDQTYPLEPISTADKKQGGTFAKIGDPRKHDQFVLEIGLHGAHRLQTAAVGRSSQLTLTSDWAHPSFSGDFLPDHSDVGEDGFDAAWSIPHLARSVPQIARENLDSLARQTAKMGVHFYQPNDFYQKAYRAARFSILFIALTFLAVMVLDRNADRPTHPVQYIMIGMLQALFSVLMVAYAEQIGLTAAYMLVSAAMIVVLTAYARLALHMEARSWVLGGVLTLLYGGLYLILQSADYALLGGSTLAFAAVAGTMFLTRSQNWYGDGSLRKSVQDFLNTPVREDQPPKPPKTP